jgi:hypothetical protein
VMVEVRSYRQPQGKFWRRTIFPRNILHSPPSLLEVR